MQCLHGPSGVPTDQYRMQTQSHEIFALGLTTASLTAKEDEHKQMMGRAIAAIDDKLVDAAAETQKVNSINLRGTRKIPVDITTSHRHAMKVTKNQDRRSPVMEEEILDQIQEEDLLDGSLHLGYVDNNLEECMTLFSRDSGYGSTASKRANAVQNYNHDIQDPSAWDSQSITSLRSSLTENTESSINPAALGGAAEELAEILMQDEMIHTLVLEGYESMDADRFERNFRRILKHYASKLRNEAKNDLEKGAVHIVHSYRAYVTRIIRKKLSLVEDEHASALDDLRKQEASKLALELFLERLQATDKDAVAIKAEDELDSDNGSEFSNDDKPYLPNLEKVKDFLISSAAFSELVQHLLKFVRPPSTLPPTPPPAPQVAASQAIEENQFVRGNAAEQPEVDSEINKTTEELDMPQRLPKRNGIDDPKLNVKQPESTVSSVQKVLGAIDDRSAIAFHVEAQGSNYSTAQVSRNSIDLVGLRRRKPHTVELERMGYKSEKSHAAGDIEKTTKITDIHLAQTGESYAQLRKEECIKTQSLRRARTFKYLQKLGRSLLFAVQNRWARSWRLKPAEGYKRIEWTCVSPIFST